MPPPLEIGDHVQTRLGKGVIREVRRHGRILVDVKGAALELDAAAVEHLESGAGARKGQPERVSAMPATSDASQRSRPADVDLHGLTVDEALAKVDAVINDALLADCAEVRLIHGRSGGRIRAAVHRRLKGITSVRAFHLDARNAGVTIVIL